MKSTFTALIQRWRGSGGKNERFKFLWNEVPGGNTPILPGMTPPCDEVLLRPNGEMVEISEGPYSWNRYSPRIETCWMREWPESFIA